MVLSGMLGIDMAFLFSFGFLIDQKRGIKAVVCFCKIFIDNGVFLVSWGQIIPTLRTIGVCGYLFRSFLPRRFPTLGYCSIPMNGLGGEYNDFNK